MKKTILLVMLFVASIGTFAQFKVHSNGKISVGITDTPMSEISVGGIGATSTANYFESEKTFLMNLKCIGDTATPTHSVTRTGLKISRTQNTEGSYTGINSNMEKSSASSLGVTTGVLGVAGNGKLNYGIRGELKGSKNGAAIIGIVGSNSVNVSSQYAGYFAGDVAVSNDLYAEGIYEESDGRFMMMQADLDSATARLENLTPLKWAWPSQVQGDDPRAYLRYSIPGQNLKQEFPLLVREADNTFHYADYIGLIPVLVQAIKELSNRIAILENSQPTEAMSQPLMTPIARNEETNNDDNMGASLKQNTPNPFNEKTTINYTLPANVSTANIYIFDMNGAMKRDITITAADNQVIVDTSSLSAGIYLYSLVINGREIDTKRMIVSH